LEQNLGAEVSHTNYPYPQLARVSPKTYRRQVWRARASRLWKRYLRLAAVLAGVFGTIVLTIQYFVLLPPFVWFANRAENREPLGWISIAGHRQESPTSQY